MNILRVTEERKEEGGRKLDPISITTSFLTFLLYTVGDLV